MSEHRKTAVAAGILYIAGTVFGILSMVMTFPAYGTESFLGYAARNGDRIRLGAMFILAMGVSLTFVAVLLFPLLRRTNKTLALAYLAFRGVLETVTYVIAAFCLLLATSLAGSLSPAESSNAAFLVLGEALQLATRLPMAVFVFSIGAFLLYYLLFVSKLIPRWLSSWGMIAIALHFCTGVLITFGLLTEQSSWNFVLNVPIFFQEMVMAVVMIVSGFSTQANANAKR